MENSKIDENIYKIACALFIEREGAGEIIRRLEAELKASETNCKLFEGWYKQTKDLVAANQRIYEEDRQGFGRTLTEQDNEIERLEELAGRRLAEIVLLKASLEEVSNATLDLVGGVLDKERRKAPMGTNKLGDPAFCLSCGDDKGMLGYFCKPCFVADAGGRHGLFHELFESWRAGARDFPRKGKCARRGK